VIKTGRLPGGGCVAGFTFNRDTGYLMLGYLRSYVLLIVASIAFFGNFGVMTGCMAKSTSDIVSSG
jgi:hypothetical protein